MKVYRGPNSKDLGDDTHQLVSTKELSADMMPWSGHYMTSANLTKEVVPERQSIAHIGLSEADVLALYRALIDEKLRMFDELHSKVNKLETQVDKFEKKLQGLKVIAGFPSFSDEEKVLKIKKMLSKQ